MTSTQKMALTCAVCDRPHRKNRPFLCAVDARNVCYEGRVQTLQLLLENDELQRRIGVLVAPPNESTAGSNESPSKAAVAENMASQRAISEDRTNQILAQAEKLRLGIATARNEIKSITDTNARKRSDLKAASTGIEGRRAKALDAIQKSIQTTRSQWNRSSDRTAATRGFLCMEAAKLYGLRRVKKGPSRYDFRLGGIDVVDLASMNGMSGSCLFVCLALAASFSVQSLR